MKRVLVVDDEENARICLVKLLCQDGHNVVAVTDGSAALDHLGNNEIDLVITDINMPRMNGLVFLRELKKSYPQIKVIMVTAYGGVGSYLESMNLGAHEYLNKPVKIGELKAIINAIFNQPSQFSEPLATL